MERKIDLMIIGAPKAGTTSLNNYIAQHPNCYTHFTTEFNMLGSMEEFNMGIEHHLNNSVDKNDLNNPEKNCFIAKRVGVMYYPEMMRAVVEKYPDCKVVAVLRNPIARSFSAFNYCKMNGVEPYQKFEDAIFINDKSRFKGDKKFERNCEYVFRSSYAQHIKSVYSIFPPENIRIYLFEEIAGNSTRPLKEIAGLLNLPEFEFDISKRHNEGSFSKSSLVAKKISSRKIGLFKKFFTVEQRMKMKAFLKKLNASKGKPEERILQAATRQHLVNVFRDDVVELDKFIDLPIKKYWPEFFSI